MANISPPAKNWTWIEYEAIDRLWGLYPTATLVYFALLRHSNKERQCWPSGKRLTETLKISSRSFWRAIRELEVAGLINRERLNKKSNTYTLLYHLGCDTKVPTQSIYDIKAPACMTPEHQDSMTPEHQEVDVIRTIPSEESKRLFSFLRNNKKRFFHIRDSLIAKFPNEDAKGRNILAKIAGFKVVQEITEDDYSQSLQFDQSKTKTTPCRHFLGILRKRLQAAGKNLDAMIAFDLPEDLK